MQRLLAVTAVMALAHAADPVPVPPAPIVVNAIAAPNAESAAADNCACNRSCQFSGCGGCCNSGAGGFLNKAIGAGCRATGMCAEVSAAPLQLNLHEHSYCHLDTTPKYARKTVWEEKKVAGTRPILVDRPKVMEKTIIDYKLEEVPSIKHGTKVIQRTQTRSVPGTKTITELMPFKIMVDKTVTEMVEEEYKVKETKYRDGIRMETRIRMEEVNRDVDTVAFTTTSSEKDVDNWVKKSILAKVRVPVVVAPLNKAPAAGATGCGCQTCSCDTAVQAKQFETVQVLTETLEKVRSKAPVVNKIPRIVQKQETVQEPVAFQVEVKFRQPFVEDVQKKRMVPRLVKKQVEVTQMRAVKRDVPFDQVEEFTEDITVPFSEPVITQVQVPYTRVESVTIFEKIAQQQQYTLVLKRPKETIEKLPPSTVCHEHKYQHSHALSPGETHSHSEEHSHPHTGDGSDFEGRIMDPNAAPAALP